ncbi:MAG: hypothetical protein GX083_01820 [Clostridiales bacterium]|nr:hypothetical protein [Clostridiales bacterium]
MDKAELYRKLDIENPQEFKFYENLSNLIEDGDYIEENLIRDLFIDVDKKSLYEFIELYFEDIMKHLPDEETDLYITFESIGRALMGMIAEDMTYDEVESLAFEFSRFRKWFSIDSLVKNLINNSSLSVRDAVFNIIAAKFLGDTIDYDFSDACNYPLEGYEVRLSDLIE